MTTLPTRSFLVGALLLGMPGLAQAQDSGSDVQIPTPTAPEVLVIGFQDRDDHGDCDPVVARYGRCVEEVDFLKKSDVFRPHDKQDWDARSRLGNMGELYAWLWDDLSFRWVGDDVMEGNFTQSGLTRLPSSPDLWDATPRGDRSAVYAVPDEDLYFGQVHWVSDDPTQTPVFRHLRYHKPSGLAAIPDVVLIKGRFAERLVFGGRKHDYDIMDGDTDSSGPFFETMYPYALAKRGGDFEDFESFGAFRDQAPLLDFIADERVKSATGDEDPEAMGLARKEAYSRVALPPKVDPSLFTKVAQDEFDNFYETLAVQIVRFARDEYTPTQLRVMTALMAMDSPPSATTSIGIVQDPNAATKYQTDEDLGTKYSSVGQGKKYAGQQFVLNYAKLPQPVIDRWVEKFPEWSGEDPKFMMDFTRQVQTEIPDILFDYVRPFEGLDDASLRAWCEGNARMPSVALPLLKRIALAMLVGSRPAEERQRLETQILLDHVQFGVLSAFDKTSKRTPIEMEEVAGKQFTSVLEAHDVYPERIPDGPGAVNPLAVCARGVRTQALEEPIYGVVTVDALAMASDGIRNPQDLIWEARDQLPFIMIDSPRATAPEVTRLFGLPDGKAIYRVRWQVWSGWHLLWAWEPIAPDGTSRVALRTAAMCEDTVLAPPDIVATVVRAAMLDGSFRPTMPVRGNGKAEAERFESDYHDEARPWEDPDTLDNAGDAAGRASSVATSAASDLDMTVLGGDVGALLPGQGKRRAVKVPPVSSEAVTYVKSLVMPRLRAMATTGGGAQAKPQPLVVVVYDESAPIKKQRVSFVKPRTPYARTRSKAGPGKFVHSALWAYYFPSTEPDPPEALVAPAYNPTESVNTSSLVQKWRRRQETDWTLVGGVGTFPTSAVHMKCNPNAPLHPESTKECSQLPLAEQESWNYVDGFTFDFSFLMTRWLGDAPRLAIEVGPETRLDIEQGGLPLLHASKCSYQHGDSLRVNWLLAPKIGILAGIRWAPSPGPLRVTGQSGFPWGADKPDGTSALGRSQLGLRAGFTLGPAYNGTEIDGSLEGWAAWTLRAIRGRKASFTPYHPGMFIGPYVRGTAGRTLIRGQAREFDLVERYNLYMGVRMQFSVAESLKDSLPGK